MVRSLKDVPGYREQEQQVASLDPKAGTDPKAPEAAVTPEVDQPQPLGEAPLRGTLGQTPEPATPSQEQNAQVKAQEPQESTRSATTLSPGDGEDFQIDLPDFSSVLEGITGQSVERDRMESDVQPVETAPVPELSGYNSVLPGLIGPSDSRTADTDVSSQDSSADEGTATPDTSGAFVDPNKNPAVLPAVRQKYRNRRMPVSIRNNNMGAVSIVGNVEGSFAARQAGFVGVTPRPKREGGYYAKYATPEHGVGAASKLLERYGRQGTNTPNKIVRKWAAEPGAYASVLVRELNAAGYEVDKNTPVDLSDPGVRKAILKAKSAHESGFGKPVYSDAVFDKGVNYRFG